MQIKQLFQKAQNALKPLSTKVFDRFFTTEGSFIGLEIQPEGIKILELSPISNGFRVDNFAILPLPHGTVVTDEIKDRTKLLDVLREAKQKVSSNRVAIALPASQVITKMIQLSKLLAEDEIEELALIEAQKSFSNLGYEVNTDFFVLGPSEENPEMLDVLLATARAENIQKWSTLLEEAGFSTEIVGIDYFAVVNACNYIARQESTPVNSTIAIAIVGQSSMSFFVIKHSVILYAREIDLEYSNQDPEAQAMLLTKIQRALQFLYSTDETIEIDLFMLAGRCPTNQKFLNEVKEVVGIPVSVANPFVQMQIPEKFITQGLLDIAPAFLLVTGLAIKGIDYDRY